MRLLSLLWSSSRVRPQLAYGCVAKSRPIPSKIFKILKTTWSGMFAMSRHFGYLGLFFQGRFMSESTCDDTLDFCCLCNLWTHACLCPLIASIMKHGSTWSVNQTQIYPKFVRSSSFIAYWSWNTLLSPEIPQNCFTPSESLVGRH